MIFSAGLPAACAATVLACLDILRSEPEHLNRLWEIVRKVREGYESIGLITHRAATPILPILVGEEEKAYRFATSLLENGIFAPPAVYPAVPRGRAIVRTVYTSAHEDRHTDHIMEVLHRLARQYRIGGGQG
jgi:glycine C-acetyltransferase